MNAAEPTENATNAPPLYTIGYGKRSLAGLLTALRGHQIEYVLDVRTAPYSRFKPEFSREPLERALSESGFRYLFLGDTLGGQPKDPDCYTGGKVDYERLKAKPYFLAGLERLKNAHRRQLRAVLLCSEGRPEECHRAKLIGAALESGGIPVSHIDEEDRLRTQREVIDRLTGGQLDLFGRPAFTSRKRYEAGPE